jgi:hypothetical protein
VPVSPVKPTVSNNKHRHKPRPDPLGLHCAFENKKRLRIRPVFWQVQLAVSEFLATILHRVRIIRRLIDCFFTQRQWPINRDVKHCVTENGLIHF